MKHAEKAPVPRYRYGLWLLLILLAGLLVLAFVLLKGPLKPVKPMPTAEPVAETPAPTPAPTPEPIPEETDETRYQAALALLEEGRYDEAAEAFAALEGYADSADRLLEVKDRQAGALLEAGDCEAAAAIWLELGGKERLYQAALDSYARYCGSGDAEDWVRCFALWGLIAPRETVSAGVNYTVGVRADGTAIATGRNKVGQLEVRGWTELAAVSAGGWHPLGLRTDGTVVSVGSDFYGQTQVSGWTDIVSISGGSSHSVGLKADGTAVAVGYNQFGQCDLGDWTELVAVAAGQAHTVGLRLDGTVVCAGANNYGQCDVQGWTDIVAVSASEMNTVGLRADGTVVAAGDNRSGQCDVQGWTDIVAVSTYANSVGLDDSTRVYFAHTLGLRADGTVVAVGSNRYGQIGVEGWTDMLTISGGGYHSAGLRADGVAVATVITDVRGDGGMSNVGDWPAMLLPPVLWDRS